MGLETIMMGLKLGIGGNAAAFPTLLYRIRIA